MKKKKSDNLDAIIGMDTCLEGDIKSSDSLRVDGKVKGNMVVEGYVIIGKGAKIEGDIECNCANVSGKVTGNITAKNELSLHSESVIIGDIKTKNLLIETGAVFDGKCNMFDQNSSKK